ncbi:MAG: alpha/beta fold hydrolase [Burkholderiaceae bacterium]
MPSDETPPVSTGLPARAGAAPAALRIAVSLAFAAWSAVFAAAPSAARDVPAEEPIEAPGPLDRLQGTLLSPGGQEVGKAVALIVPGSGPTDRDGNSPQGLQAATYRLLAEGLAARGIASVRIDKRGLFGSRSAVRDANDVTISDYAQDVHRWVSAVRERTNARCVWVIGHSEGGIVALKAAESGTGICGLVLAATPGRPLGQVLRAQLRANPANAPLLDAAERAIETLESGRRVEMATLPPPLRPLFRPAVQGFLIDSFAVDPARLAGAFKGPMLVLQGARDLQIGPDNARLLRQAAAQAKLVVLPTANHVLKPVATDAPTANVATYGRADLELAPGVVEAITEFIEANPAR